jgi:CheY-like chemotaxis protein
VEKNRPNEKATILVVDDEGSVRNLFALVLSEMGYAVLDTSSAALALQMLERKGDRGIDLLLVDIAMPEMNGKELAARALQISPRIKVLFCSGNLEELALLCEMGQSRIPYFQKPVSMVDLERKVREILAGPDQGLQEVLWQATRLGVPA